MNTFLVAEARLLKTKAISRHEYLSLRVVAPDGDSFYLALERGRGEIKEDYDIDRDTYTNSPDELVPPPASAPASLLASASPSSTHLPFSSSQPDVSAPPFVKKPSFIKRNTSSSIASLDSLFGTRGADDRISPLNSSGKHNSNDEEFCTLTFAQTHETLPSSSSSPSPSCLPLYKLAVLADTIHGMNSEYQLFSSNCFFYAGVIIKILREMYRPEFKTEKTAHDKWALIRKRQGRQLKAGTWNGMEVWDGSLFDTAKLKGVFASNLDKFEKPVSFFDFDSFEDYTIYWVWSLGTRAREYKEGEGCSIGARDKAQEGGGGAVQSSGGAAQSGRGAAQSSGGAELSCRGQDCTSNLPTHADGAAAAAAGSNTCYLIAWGCICWKFAQMHTY